MARLNGPTRRPWLRLHRWLGLALGPVFVLLGLTGSLLVFYTEIDARIDPALAGARAQAPIAAWQPVLDALQRAHPARDRGWRIEIPPEGRGLVTARYLRPAETEGEFFAPLLVTVEPDTGQVVASRFWGRFAATWVFDLHYTLLLGEAGRVVVGVLGLLLAVSIVAGLALWWPRRGQWAAALRIRLGGSAQRRHYDLHKAAGLSGALVLGLLALTGAALALPSIVEPMVHAASSPLQMLRPSVARDPARTLLPMDAVLARVQARFPEGRARWVDTPATGSALWRVRLWLPGDPSRRFPRSYAWVHGHSGEVIAVRDARLQGGGDTLLAWLHPLHNGEAFGMAGRVVTCVAGLLPLALGVTGWLRWRDRRRARFLAPTPTSRPRRGDLHAC